MSVKLIESDEDAVFLYALIERLKGEKAMKSILNRIKAEAKAQQSLGRSMNPAWVISATEGKF